MPPDHPSPSEGCRRAAVEKLPFGQHPAHALGVNRRSWIACTIKRRFKAARTPLAKVAAGLLLWALMVGSKFVVLEVIAFFFADRVSLGGFFSVTLLILALLLARLGVRRLLAVDAAPAPPG